MNMQPVSPKARTLWRVINAIWLAVLTAAMTVVLALWGSSHSFPPVAAILGLCWLVVAALLMVWPGLRYSHYAYGFDDKRLCIQSGVIFRHRIVAPICQIQDLHFYEGPVMRLLGLGRVMFATGGSNFDLTGLPKQEALAMIEELESRLRARIEVQDREEI